MELFDMTKKKKITDINDALKETVPQDLPEETATDAATTPELVPEAEVPDPVELRLLRLQADFDNYRKRMVRERQEWAQRAAEDLVTDLLPVLDHYEMGMDMAKTPEYRWCRSEWLQIGLRSAVERAAQGRAHAH